MDRAIVHVDGVVQSVGFRPFVYRTATDLGLRGTVRNLGDAGVRIELEGDETAIDAFLTRLQEDPPPLATVETVEVDRERDVDATHETFAIHESAAGGRDADTGSDGDDAAGPGTIPPDTAICEACLADVRDSDSRYHGYWATACVDCGPRFTVVEALPYDRPTTSMAAFPMCGDCRDEYEDPGDRRYHAQAIACPECGPTLRFGVVDGSTADSAPPESHTDGGDPFPDALATAATGASGVAAAARALSTGEIVVVKGVGGAHLACDATDPSAVARLRDRTGRPAKPFALMVPDLDTAERIARVSTTERTELTAPRRPILLLEARDTGGVVPDVAPGLHTIGVMLPYAGVHHLLFDHLDGPLVLTSANRPGQPMHVANGSIVDGLGDVADGFLLHDRRIVSRCDDSVARVVDGHRRLIRRSRGFAPTPVGLPGGDGAVLALGPELDVTPGVLADGRCYLTQYIGDVDTVATFEYLQAAIDHLLSIVGLSPPDVVAHDLHPEFHTTDLARRMEREAGRTRVPVQHHHAHAASVLAEHDRDAAIAVTVDGVGFGPDGTVWGGEVLDVTRTDYERVGGLAPLTMPGGDRATRFPGRMLAGGLFAHADHDIDHVRTVLANHGVSFPSPTERDVVFQQLERGVNTPDTTSAGRFLDGVSALLGVCDERHYEGEPAMKLEAVATDGCERPIEVPMTTVDGRPAVDTPALLARLVTLREEGTSRADVAATAQDALAQGLADLALEAADRLGREVIALSGGVAYNDHIARRFRQRVEAAGGIVLGNEQVPPGDGGIAYGQAAIAAATIDQES